MHGSWMRRKGGWCLAGPDRLETNGISMHAMLSHLFIIIYKIPKMGCF